MTETPENGTGDVVGLDLPALQAWFTETRPGVGVIRAQLLQGGRSNLTYRITDDRDTWVLRRPPRGALTPSAHDMGREYRVVAALWGGEVPVARPVAQCADPAVLRRSGTHRCGRDPCALPATGPAFRPADQKSLAN